MVASNDAMKAIITPCFPMCFINEGVLRKISEYKHNKTISNAIIDSIPHNEFKKEASMKYNYYFISFVIGHMVISESC